MTQFSCWTTTKQGYKLLTWSQNQWRTAPSVSGKLGLEPLPGPFSLGTQMLQKKRCLTRLKPIQIRSQTCSQAFLQSLKYEGWYEQTQLCKKKRKKEKKVSKSPSSQLRKRKKKELSSVLSIIYYALQFIFHFKLCRLSHKVWPFYLTLLNSTFQ